MTVSDYNIWGKKYFDTWMDKNADCQILIFPSFQQPTALYVYALNTDSTRIVAKEKCGYNYTTNNSENKVITNVLPVKKIIAKKIALLFMYAVGSAMMTGERYGCDGTVYFLFHGSNVAQTWSPDSGNACKIIDLLHDILNGVKKKNVAEVESLMPRVDSLKQTFKSLYPDDFHEAQCSTYTINDNGHDKTRVSFFTCNDEFEIKFPISNEGNNDSTICQKYKEKYGKLIEEISRKLFINTDLHENSIYAWKFIQHRCIIITVDNSKQQSFEKSGNTIYLSIHENNLNEDKLLRILQDPNQLNNCNDSIIVTTP